MPDQDFQADRERRIDKICDEFEQQLRTGGQPDVDAFLRRVEPDDRPKLSRELLMVAVEYSSPNLRPQGPVVARCSHNTTSGGEAETAEGGTGSRSAGDAPIVGGRLGDYELLEQIGAGGMGAVYRARQISVGRIVALKIMRPDQWRDLPADQRSRAVDRFLTESQAAARRDHPHLLTVYDAGRQDGAYYLAMQYADGGSLADRVLGGPLEDRQAAAYLEPVCRALHAVHSAGIIHRDLKPSNILVEAESDRPLVGDFGLAKVFDSSQGLTVSGEVFGTPSYMSPEQVLGADQVTAATDVYGVGATLYHLLTARPPFQASTVPGVVHQVLTAEPVPPHMLNPAVGRDMETITLKCLEKEPHRRYPSALAVAQDLQRYLAGQPIWARPLRGHEKLYRWARSHRSVATLLVALAATLISAVVVVSVLYAREREAGAKAAQAIANEREQMHLNCVDNARLTEPSPRSLAWLLQALKLDQDDPIRERADRTRMAQIWDLCYRPIQMWFRDTPVEFCGFSSSGRFMFALADEPSVEVWESEPNRPVIGPLRLPGRVTFVCFSPDERLVAAVCNNGTGIVWDLAKRGPVGVPLTHDAAIRRAVFSSDSSQLATASLDQTASVWNARTGQRLAHLRHPKQVLDLCFTADDKQLVTTCADGACRVWDLDRSELRAQLQHSTSAYELALSGDGRLALTFDARGAGRLWDMSGFVELLAGTISHPPRITGALFSPSGDWVITGGLDGSVRLWDTQSGAAIGSPLVHGSPIETIAIDRRGEILLSAARDGSIITWSLATGRPTGPSVLHGAAVSCAALAPDGRRILAAYQDGVVSLWEAPPRATVIADNQRASLAAVQLSDDSQALLLGDQQGVVRIASLVDGTVRDFDQRRHLSTAAFNFQRGIAVSTGRNGSIFEWELGDRDAPRQYQHGDSVLAVLVERSGSYVVTVGRDGSIKLWQRGGRLVSTLEAGTPLRLAEVDEPSQRIVTLGGARGDVWELAGDKLLRRAAIQGEHEFLLLDLAAGGRRLATCDAQGWVRMWSADSGKPVGRAIRYRPPVSLLVAYPTGDRIVAVSHDGYGSLHQIEQDASPPLPLQEDRPLVAAAACGDGTLLAVAFDDGLVRISDGTTAEQLSGPILHGQSIKALLWTSDGSGLVICDRFGGVRVLPVIPDRRSLDELQDDITLLTGEAVDRPGQAHPLSAADLESAWRLRQERLRSRLPAAPAAREQ